MERGVNARGRQPLGKQFTILGTATVVFGALPYAVFALERWAGLLPGEAAWLEQGWNHGPWRWEAEGFTIFYPLAVLGLVTIFLAARQTLKRRRMPQVAHSTILLAVQFLLAMLQAETLFWLID